MSFSQEMRCKMLKISSTYFCVHILKLHKKEKKNENKLKEKENDDDDESGLQFLIYISDSV